MSGTAPTPAAPAAAAAPAAPAAAASPAAAQPAAAPANAGPAPEGGPAGPAAAGDAGGAPPPEGGAEAGATPPEQGGEGDAGSTERAGGADALPELPDQPGRGSDRHQFVRDAQQRFGGDAVSGDKIVFYLTGGEQSAPLTRLAPTLEEYARHAFVFPERWDACRADFQDRRSVLLQGVTGGGRVTMAIRLLLGVESQVIYQLDPRIDLSRMAEQLTARRFERGTAFLLCQPDDVGRLDASTFDRLEAALRAADARLVLTVGSEAPIRDESLLRHRISLPAAPPRREILRTHLRYRLDDETRADGLLAQPAVAELVREKLDRDSITCEVAAILAMLLSRESETVDVARIRAMLMRRDVDEFGIWFDGLADLELRCFAIALAVLDGQPFEEVAAAARRLHQRLSAGGPLVVDDDASLRVAGPDPFRMPPIQLLRTLQARTTEGTIRTPYGYAPATEISYRNPDYPRRVIERAWKGYRIQDQILDWLGDLVMHRSDEIRVSAGTAVGFLATLAFEYVRRAVLHEWAASDNTYRREAVADVLRVAAGVPELQTAVTWLVDGWYRAGSPELQSTAALAHGTRLGRTDTTRSVRALERLAMVTDLQVQFGICRGFAALLAEEPEQYLPLFYGVVERCLADPKRTDTAQLMFLFVAADLLSDVTGADGAKTRWPTLLLLATRHGHLRRPLIESWARTLAGSRYSSVAEHVLRIWASYAESDAAIRKAFTRLVRAVAESDPWAGAVVTRQARRWDDEDALIPMPNVAQAVNAVLLPEHSTR
ncbi:hypothetical protein [Plantactinospora sp. BB1]|uniref:hypothetical protein n=1 Tax=Plantactinospora sp. BB1 TaxID=2071627 RepID=UPI000D15EB32|nr:hypothetical protein [Plantactinospora sp. BB1]AVT38468.1 hypothetical protein C6W10_20745 [Plantactinospora sp. BB1]